MKFGTQLSLRATLIPQTEPLVSHISPQGGAAAAACAPHCGGTRGRAPDVGGTRDGGAAPFAARMRSNASATHGEAPRKWQYLAVAFLKRTAFYTLPSPFKTQFYPGWHH